MDCEQMRLHLDAYMDETLSDAALREMTAHAEVCEACRQEWNATKFLRESLRNIDDEIEVPLPAQAAWRKAIRDEEKRRRTRRWTRSICSVAAAAVLVVGGVQFLNSAPQDMAMNNEANIRMEAEMDAEADLSAEMIDMDGGIVASAEATEENVAARMKIAADDSEAAAQAVADLAAEYGGSCTDQAEVLRVELPADGFDDFLNAVGRIGEALDTQIGTNDAPTAVLLIQLSQK